MNGTEVMKDIFSRSTSLGEMLFDSMRDNIRFGVEQLNAKPKKLYDAAFGEPKELLNELNTGFSISGKAQITKELSFMNSAIIGGTGTGKTSVNAICTCLNTQNASLIIHDPPGQLIEKVGADFIKRGFKVYVFDPSNPNGSISINPLDDIKDQQDINKIATHWNKSSMGEGGSEKFWTLASINATRTFLSLLLLQPKQYRNMANLKHLFDVFSGNPKAVHPLAAKAPDTLYSEYRALLAGNEKTMKSIIMTSSAALNLFGDDAVCKVTANTTIDFDEFRKTPSVLFIKNSTFHASYIQPLISMILEQMFQRFMQRLPDKGDLPIFFVVDEAATLKLDSLDQVVCNNRKYSMGVMLLFQNLAQVFYNFKQDKASTILSNCHSKLFYGSMDMRTAKDLAELLGKRTVTNANGDEIVTDLMHAQDIRMLKYNEALFISGAHKPYKLKLTPYYLNPMLRKRTEGKPFVYRNPNPIKNIQLLPLK
jgi:type IV secretion system protein VirD4